MPSIDPSASSPRFNRMEKNQIIDFNDNGRSLQTYMSANCKIEQKSSISYILHMDNASLTIHLVLLPFGTLLDAHSNIERAIFLENTSFCTDSSLNMFNRDTDNMWLKW